MLIIYNVIIISVDILEDVFFLMAGHWKAI